MDKNQTRAAIVALHRKNRSLSDIAKLLAMSYKSVWRIVKRYQEQGTAADRPRSGRPRSVNTAQLRSRVKKRIKRNSCRSMRKMAKEVGVNRETLRLVVERDLGLRPYKLLQGQALTELQTSARMTKCRALLRRFANGRHREILFTDEKLFAIEQKLNHQNDRQLLPTGSGTDPARKRVTRSQFPASVMAWGGVCATGKTPLIFIERGVKINAQIYQDVVLRDTVVPWADAHFGKRDWVFQQDGATAHSALTTQALCSELFPSFISKTEWPANSPDLNPMDYSIWSILESKVCTRRYSSLEALKRDLTKAWDEIDDATLTAIADNFPKRLKACIAAGGGHFEM